MFDIFQQPLVKKDKRRVRDRAGRALVTLMVTTLFFVTPLVSAMQVNALNVSVDTNTVQESMPVSDVARSGVLPTSLRTVSGSTKTNTMTAAVTSVNSTQASSVAINLKNRSGKLTTTLDKATKADFKLVMDGKEVKLSMPTLVADGRTYLPVRALGEELLKAKVNYDEKNGIAIVNRNGIIVETFAGSNKVVVNGNVQDIDQTSYIQTQ